MNIEEALEEFNFFNEGDYITKNMSIAKDVVLTAYEKEKEEHKKECHNCDEYTAKLGELETENRMLKSELEKEKNKPDCAEPIERTEEMVNMKWVNYRYINKEKLKEILGIEENLSEERILSLLKTIVSENSRLEDIEDRKVQIEYNNVFNKGVKSVEAKIKAKIEEYKKQVEKDRKEIKESVLRSVVISDKEERIQELQSLLEKE